MAITPQELADKMQGVTFGQIGKYSREAMESSLTICYADRDGSIIFSGHLVDLFEFDSGFNKEIQIIQGYVVSNNQIDEYLRAIAPYPWALPTPAPDAVIKVKWESNGLEWQISSEDAPSFGVLNHDRSALGIGCVLAMDKHLAERDEITNSDWQKLRGLAEKWQQYLNGDLRVGKVYLMNAIANSLKEVFIKGDKPNADTGVIDDCNRAGADMESDEV